MTKLIAALGFSTALMIAPVMAQTAAPAPDAPAADAPAADAAPAPVKHHHHHHHHRHHHHKDDTSAPPAPAADPNAPKT